MIKNPIVFLAALACFALSGSLAFSAEGKEAGAGMRLIQTAQGRSWMTPGQIASLMRASHEAGHCGGFMDVTDYPRKQVLKAVPLLDFAGRPITRQDQIHPLLAELSATELRASVEALSRFPNRYYDSTTGVQGAEWIKTRFTELAAHRTDIEVTTMRHKFKQPSVIAKIRGNGPKAAETVVFGAHQDSVSWQSGGNPERMVAPGADDDASGVATMLEIFRILAQSGFRPERTIEFMAYAGEEVGLLGSQAIAQTYRREGRKVVAVFQLDMTMFPGSGGQIVMISDHVNAALTGFTTRLIDQYVHLPWRQERCGYACSDHASWDEAGFAATFPFEATTDNYNRAIHTTRDTLDILDEQFGLAFAKLGLAFAVELAQ